MPTYDYQCGACEHRFELFQSITAKAVKKCPACGKLKVRRLIGTGAGVIFKGSGFYCTDYRGKDYTEAAKKDSAGPGGATGSSTSDGAGASTGVATKTENATAKTESATATAATSSSSATPSSTGKSGGNGKK